MNKKWTRDIQTKVIARAWKDEAFRNTLLNNPKEALKEFDIEFPKNVVMKVQEEDDNHLYLVLPNAPYNLKEFSNTELERIAAAGCGLGCRTFGTITA